MNKIFVNTSFLLLVTALCFMQSCGGNVNVFHFTDKRPANNTRQINVDVDQTAGRPATQFATQNFTGSFNSAAGNVDRREGVSASFKVSAGVSYTQ